MQLLEILVEEISMESFLETILPSILPDAYRLHENCFIRPHEGKQHLKRSIIKKVRAYRHYPHPVKLLLIHDQDSDDCKKLKDEITGLVRQADQQIPLLVRIACRELENWYLGDLPAVEKLYPETKAGKLTGKEKYRNPDNLFGANEMKRLSKDFRKSDCAKRLGEYMDLNNNKSVSFNNLIKGVKDFCI